MEKNLLQRMQLNFAQIPADAVLRANTKSQKDEQAKPFAGNVQIPEETAVGPEA